MTSRHPVPQSSPSSDLGSSHYFEGDQLTDFASREFALDLAMGPAVKLAIDKFKLSKRKFREDIGMSAAKFASFLSGTDVSQEPVNPVVLIKAFENQGALFLVTDFARNFFKRAMGDVRDLSWWNEAKTEQRRIRVEHFPEYGVESRHHLVRPAADLAISFAIPYAAPAA